jgi:hypothetical protein
MMTDSTEPGWDDLAKDFGLDDTATAPSPAAEASAEPRTRDAKPFYQGRPKVKPVHNPEPVAEDGDFGTEIGDAPEPMFDPGPDEVVDAETGSDDFGDEPETEGGEPASEGGEPGQEGKKKRRRRRRKKKKGPGDGTEAVASPEGKGVAEGSPDGDEGEPVAAAAARNDDEDDEDDATSDAPQAIDEGDDDDDDGPMASAVDEEMDYAASLPKQEWKVVTWNELVSKLYRPN